MESLQSSEHSQQGVLLVFLLLFLIISVPVEAITEEEIVEILASVSMSLKEFGNDIEKLTTESKADSQEQNKRLDNLEKDFREIENGSGDMKKLDPEFELQLKNLTSSFGEFKKKELIEDIIQWVVIAGLTAYATRDTWSPCFN